MSTYPDGTRNAQWERFNKVILPRRDSTTHVRLRDIESVVCHRRTTTGHEEYLVQWKSQSKPPPYSWHDLHELKNCLEHVQKYIDGRRPSTSARLLTVSTTNSRKRRSEEPLLDERPRSVPRSTSSSSSARPSPAPSTQSTHSSSSTLSFNATDTKARAYNGFLTTHDGSIKVRSTKLATTFGGPTELMLRHAQECAVTQAEYEIQSTWDRHLSEFGARTAPLTIRNDVDGSRPPLKFRFNDSHVLGEGVERVSDAIITGCGQQKRRTGPNPASQLTSCRPDMGMNRGCEYSRVCECLENAAVDEARLGEEENALFKAREYDTLPKRFPYKQSGDMQVLQSFYLESRHAIYECNQRCGCGPGCKTKLVQKGRRVPLEIFHTGDRGWGLRCKEDLIRGEFIDTYRGEIITDEEATKREEHSGSAKGLKASYLYSLDKYAVDDDEATASDIRQSECYVIDGELQGGPSRFINHSCNPNVRQFTVSYNKYDRKVYELAFFALDNIPAMTELTFDYQDHEDDDNENIDAATGDNLMLECRCGSRKCRGRLWV